MDAGDLAVWLERNNEPTLIRPYARAAARAAVEYRVAVRRTGLSGQSSIVQGGSKVLEPGAATSLGTIRVTRSPHDVCTVEVSIAIENGESQLRRFDCPLP